MSVAKHFSRKYLREEVLPTPFCPGCFNGVVMNAMFKAMEELGIEDLRNFVFVSGIGCSSWIPNPLIRADSLHTLHGRAVAVATGVKLANPRLNVVVIGGDGDLVAIGGNHLLHAARRNMDLLVVMVNNMVYAMTRGQLAPTTPLGFRTATTPYGNFEPPINVAKLLINTNANYVARWCVSNFHKLKQSFKEALSEVSKGFRFIEVVAPCITYVVRYEGKTPGQKIKELREACVEVKSISEIDDVERRGKIAVGVFKKELKPGYVELYESYASRAREASQK
ncbi:MAG: 2-oxoacid:ferredoxin oxidoreductase subunit beta [Crenarchaeota archaeon]|nr:2-oxoacid:ferredoxin oxidoreductase subunit beta [Thermoproteota archaeon]